MRWDRRSPKGLMNGWLYFSKYEVQAALGAWHGPWKKSISEDAATGIPFFKHVQVTAAC